VSKGFHSGSLACAKDCRIDPSGCKRCGDGEVNGPEDCDGSALGDKTCAAVGFDGGELKCTAKCAFDTSACYKCGDAVKNGSELCDGSDLGTATCKSAGFDDGTLKCTAQCAFDTSACDKCGDGVTTGKEKCDGNDLAGKTCKTQGFDGGTLKCNSATCAFDTSACYKCGDGVKNGGDQCDGTDFGAMTCKSFGYDSGSLKCTATCTIDTSSCQKCNDGKVSGTEECDGSELGGKTCQTAGFIGGYLRCKSDCTRDTSWCYRRLDPVDIAVAVGTTSQGSPALAFDGTNYLVVWDDGVTGSVNTAGDIYGARVSKAMIVLDALPIPISKASCKQSTPAVVFNGKDFLAAWGDNRSSCISMYSSDIYASRITTGGITSDPAGLAVNTEEKDQTLPAMACDGTHCLIVWGSVGTNATDIRGARINSAGALVDATPITISAAANSQSAPSVAFDGTNYFVVWSDGRNGGYTTLDIYGARVSTAGVVLDPLGIGISTLSNSNQSTPAVAFDGTQYLVVWYDSRNSLDTDIYGSRISTAGVVSDTAGLPIGKAAGVQTTPAVACDGTTHCLVVWDDRRSGFKVFGAPINRNGDVLDPTGMTIADAVSAGAAPAVIWNGAEFFVVWRKYKSVGTDDVGDIYGVRVSR